VDAGVDWVGVWWRLVVGVMDMGAWVVGTQWWVMAGRLGSWKCEADYLVLVMPKVLVVFSSSFVFLWVVEPGAGVLADPGYGGGPGTSYAHKVSFEAAWLFDRWMVWVLLLESAELEPLRVQLGLILFFTQFWWVFGVSCRSFVLCDEVSLVV